MLFYLNKEREIYNNKNHERPLISFSSPNHLEITESIFILLYLNDREIKNTKNVGTRIVLGRETSPLPNYSDNIPQVNR